MEAMITNLMVNKTKALTGGRDGHDSKCWFYKENLYDIYGPITDDKFEIEIILRKNIHALVENAVVPGYRIKGDI